MEETKGKPIHDLFVEISNKEGNPRKMQFSVEQFNSSITNIVFLFRGIRWTASFKITKDLEILNMHVVH